jgi:hypothetical protein
LFWFCLLILLIFISSRALSKCRRNTGDMSPVHQWSVVARRAPAPGVCPIVLNDLYESNVDPVPANLAGPHFEGVCSFVQPPPVADEPCCICLDRERTHAFVSCGHRCMCGVCAGKMENVCPICKQVSMSAPIRIFS